MSAKCYHVNLKRQLVGDFAWYRCMNPDCNQKFLPGKREEPLIPWDGKLRAMEGADASPMTLQEAQQSMLESEVKLRDYMAQEKRSAKELSELCLGYHMAYDVYEFRKAGGNAG